MNGHTPDDRRLQDVRRIKSANPSFSPSPMSPDASSPLPDLLRQLLVEVGEDPRREGLRKTPERFLKAWKRACSGYGERVEDVITTFDAESFDEMVVVRDIEFYSTCEHHLLPFFGRITVGYLPNRKIVGLSKIPRITEIFARRLQNQERLTMQIANALMAATDAKGVGVIVSAQHLCMMARGVEKQGASVETSCMLGRFKNDPRTRSEFLQLIR